VECARRESNPRPAA